MANWKFKINIKDLHDSYQDGIMSIQDVSKGVAQRLQPIINEIKRLPETAQDLYLLEDVEILQDNFKDFSNDQDITVYDYDDLLNDLYDWADTILPDDKGTMRNRLCWINTI